MPRGSIDERKRVDVIGEAGVYQHARQSEEWCVCACVHFTFTWRGFTRFLLSKTRRESWWPPILNIDFLVVETGGAQNVCFYTMYGYDLSNGKTHDTHGTKSGYAQSHIWSS